MSKRYAITNLSTLKGEILGVGYVRDGKTHSKELRPGESHIITSGEDPVDIGLMAYAKKNTQPFRLNGKQVFPFMVVGFKENDE